MSPTRRQLLAGLGGTTLAYVLQIGCAPGQRGASSASGKFVAVRPDHPGVDYRNWLLISADGTVTVHSSRTEIGQGFTTVLYNLVGQALELPVERINIVLGDTDLCPSDGPTTGSAATQFVGWAYWLACHEIRKDLILLAAEAMGEDPEALEYRRAEIVMRRDPSRKIGMGDLANGQIKRLTLDPGTGETAATTAAPSYVDRETLNANAEAIVTGTLRYAGDFYPEDCLYGGVLVPEYHRHLTHFVEADLDDSVSVPGISDVYTQQRRIVTAVGDSFTAVQKALDAARVTWEVPERPEELRNEEEIRAGATLVKTVEAQGDPEARLAAADLVVTETYVTQYASQVPMETDTAVAYQQNGRPTLRICTQDPFRARFDVAKQRGVAEQEVHVIATPCGGAFGSKASGLVAQETARMAQRAGVPVKHVYSRLADIQQQARYKESVIVDISSGVGADGRIAARTIDYFQDEGHGSEELYAIPDVQTRLWTATMPTRHATMRGTSYTQNIFAIESHTDMVARSAGVDPLEFRKNNVVLDAFEPLVDGCAEMLGYAVYEAKDDHGMGFAICNHGGRQLAAVGAEVRVDRQTGRIAVLRLAGAFDIGLIINRHTATIGVKGAMIWGLGYALFEEVELDGHRCHTTGFNSYRIPRVADVPPIQVRFLDNAHPGAPRGCGEAPTPPTIAAIANAVYDAVGIRFYELPMTRERVKAALEA